MQVGRYADRPMSAPDQFEPQAHRTFRIGARSFDSVTRTISLAYALDDGPSFVETITFETPLDPAGPTPNLGPGFERALHHLHIAAGTSYYKTAAPDLVVVEGGGLTEVESDFHHHLYDDGLREFAVTNGLPVPRPVTIQAQDTPLDASWLSDRLPGAGLLVPIGGGKDSMVLIEAVRHLEPLLFAVNPRPLVERLVGEAGLPLMVVRRRLDPGLADLNRRGALNGHVPITAIVSLIAVVGAFLYGYDTIALAVERSASEETRLVDGVPVNHQYSKSAPFEAALDRLVRTTVSPGITVGSALRPWSELAISRAFAGTGRYRSTFCSCNSVFRQDAAHDARWCGDCPKCRFVALMLAPFLGRSELTEILGADLFADPAQITGFAALMSDANKPFECVGERRESAAALRLLVAMPEWADSPVVIALGSVAEQLVDDADLAELLAPGSGPAFAAPQVVAAVAALLEGA